MAALSLVISCESDFPAQSTVKVCGGAPELGNWDPAAAPELKYDVSRAAFVASVPLPAAAAGVEYKLVARHAARADSDWIWLQGPNRRVDRSGEPVHINWILSRDGTDVIASDGYLEPHRGHLAHRYKLFNDALAAIEAHGGGLDRFSRGWEHFGFNRETRDGRRGIVYREWAPAARAASLVGEFNGWDDSANPCVKDDFGTFTCFLPDREDGTPAIAHNSFVKVSLIAESGEKVLRLPAWTRYAEYDKSLNEYVAKYWNPPASARHSWKHPRPTTPHAATDYRPVLGMHRLPSRTDWTGPVAPWESSDASAAAGGAGGAGVGSVSAVASAATGADSAAEALSAVSISAAEEKPRPPSGQPGARAGSSAGAGAAGSRAGSGSGAGAGGGRGGGGVDPAHAGLRIYEAHVGMSSAEEKVNSYRDFADNVLPRIEALGYNCVQLMAIMEHAYYGSFGYHVTSFLAPSSRFGTPEDLKYLVDTAHGMGLLIIMDLVHSHAAKNVNDGINRFDGSDHQYFHAGARGNHDLWDSRLFDYSKLEVQRFLLSSARLFIEEFRFDGYRFDGVTSMMYLHHGLSVGFSGGYHEYFGDSTDLSAVVYLMLANYMLHTVSPPAISIAEDVSGMPTLGRPVYEGGVGFDYRLAMAIPDQWIKLLKEQKDEDWDLGNVVFTLTNRRHQEKTIAYAESHDQALVGDKTLSFQLMDKAMYDHMSTLEKPLHPVVDRGLALHKMLRLITYSLGGEGYLNFMGNEFGHPEWIDFPREGNGWSYKYCRRQWNLVDDDLLHYKHLNNFDCAMHKLEDAFPWLISRDNFVSLKDNGNRMVAFDRGTEGGPLVFVFNFHPTASYTDYRIGVPRSGEWVLALDSDAAHFGGHSRLDPASTSCRSQAFGWDGRPDSIQVYTPCRSVQVYKLKGTGEGSSSGGAAAVGGAGAGSA